MTNVQSEPDQSESLQFRLELKAESGLAVAALEMHPASESSGALTAEAILQALEEADIADWKIDEGAIEDVINKYKKQKKVRILIAERKDASFSLKIRQDKLAATLQVSPPKGGQPVAKEAVEAALLEKNVDKKRIVHAAIAEACESDKEDAYIVARGKPPINGKDSFFKSLFALPEIEETPEEDEQGRVDFYAGREYIIVEPGTPLIERLPPLPGKVGMDIFGQIITAESGKEIPFGKELNGTEFASDNPNMLIAAVSGHPVFSHDGARVDDTLQFENVGVETGHIEFDGSVNISGDVMADINIDVTGDVFIKGVVERANIKAGHDIHVAGGVLGDTSIQIEDNEPLPDLHCSLQAGRDVSARYVNLASITSGKNIHIKEYAFHSKLRADDSILMGQKGGKGNLVGGETFAGHALIAKLLGNPAYNQTIARIGVTREELQQAQKLKFLREQRLNQARGLRRILDHLKQQGETETLGKLEIEKAKKVHDALLNLQEDVKDIDQRLRNYTFATYRDDEPNITATSACFPNCSITINGAFLQTKQEHKAISFIKRGRKITAKS